jgi:acyl-coenzyme A synthetase/AMP-(fatty) acid ligase
MVPRRITLLHILPRNANGKIDRIALQGVASQPV